MINYESVREAIWLDESLGNITTEQAIEADKLAYQIYVTEGTSMIKKFLAKRGVKQFKKMYKFEPINGSKTEGYITVDGKKTRVDLDVFNPVMKVKSNGKYVYMPRQTAAETDNEERVIHIDKNTASMIILKAKKAIYDHEFAHLDFDGISSDVKMHHPKVVDERIRSSIKSLGYDPNNKDIYDQIAKEVKPWADRYLKDIEKLSKAERKKRDDLYNMANKYVSDSPHSSTSEIVADAVSVAKNGKFFMALGLTLQVKKTCTKNGAVDELYAKFKSNILNDPVTKKKYKKATPEERKEINKKLHDVAVMLVDKNWETIKKAQESNYLELKDRIKAMDDKNIQNHEYIKKYRKK